MTLVVDRPVLEGEKAVHVLIVIVGKYDLPKYESLAGAADLAGDLVKFWRDAESRMHERQRIASIDVLASDPDQDVVVPGDVGDCIPEPPLSRACKDALLDWIKRIADSDGSVGYLHWVGHGFTKTMHGFRGLSLLCQDVHHRDKNEQSGIAWTPSLTVMNEIAKDREVYCFIDTCRVAYVQGLEYFAIDEPSVDAPDHIEVFYSARSGEEAFWQVPVEGEETPPEFRGHALGTRAFMLGLESYGARMYRKTDAMHWVYPGELSSGAGALVKMWAEFYDAEGKANVSHDGRLGDAMMVQTSRPKAVVRVLATTNPAATSADALHVNWPQPRTSHGDLPPFPFALERQPHKFRVDGGQWSDDIEILYANQPIHE